MRELFKMRTCNSRCAHCNILDHNEMYNFAVRFLFYTDKTMAFVLGLRPRPNSKHNTARGSWAMKQTYTNSVPSTLATTHPLLLLAM